MRTAHRLTPLVVLRALLLTALIALTTSAVAQDDPLLERARSLFEPIPLGVAELSGHDWTPAKEELGRTLWFDPRLSSSWAISCNSCHNVGMAGVDLQPTSIGHDWQRGGRNSPTMYNAVFNVAQFWDGRAEDLASQAMGPIQDAIEMNSTPGRVIATLGSMPGYVDLFDAAFPDQADPITFENVALAIETFEATLLTPNAPFDAYLRGDTGALTPDETRGLEAFLDRGCAGCHLGVNLGGTDYYPFGVIERPDAFVLPEGDLGRFAITDVEGDLYAFKSPSLRNIELTPPYFHSGTIWNLRDAVRIMGDAQLGSQLTEEEVVLITGFLRTLTGEFPTIEYPVLPALGQGTPPPVISTPRAP